MKHNPWIATEGFEYGWDFGGTVEVYDDGKVLCGEIVLEELWTGEGEYPIAMVEIGDNWRDARHLCAYEFFRFVG